MKIKVERTEQGIVRLKFESQEMCGSNPYLFESEIKTLIDNEYGCSTDLNYTVRRMEDRLIIFYDNKCTVDIRMNVGRFFNACLSIPIGKEIVMDSNSFNKWEAIDRIDVRSWVEIGKWIDPSCRKNIFNAKRIGLHHELKPLLGRYVGKAKVWPDGDRLNLSFYFNGRIQGGCGYNGGIICHGAGTDTFAVELTAPNRPHYSVHT